MKKLSFIAALTLSTMLSACGGGGSGHSFVPPTTIPDITNPDTPGTNVPTPEATNEDLTMMKTRVVADDNGFAGLVNNTLVSAYQEHSSSSGARRARRLSARANDNNYMSNPNICESGNDCNQEIFENMKKILIEQNLANASEKELRNALILAGFKDALSGIWDDATELKKYIREHPEEVREKAEAIRDSYTTTIDNANLTHVEYEAEQSTSVSFVLDDTKKINGIKFKSGDDVKLVSRQGDKNEFANSEKVYIYGLRIGTDCTKGACAPGQGHSLTVETNEKLNDINEIKSKLIASFEEEYKEGGMDSLHGGTNNGIFQEGDKEKFHDYAIKFIQDLPADAFSDTNTDMDTITYDHAFYNEADITLKTDYQSYAKDMKLAYSDFGLMKLDVTEKYMTREQEEKSEEITIFAGGYDAKKIEAQNLKGEDMTFKGKAIGGVNFEESENWVDNKDVTADTLLLTSNDNDNAELTFNKGKEKLTAKFDNWYDVEMTTEVGKDNGTLKFSNGNKVQGTAKVDAENFKFRGQDNYTVTDFKGEQMIKAYGTEHIVVGQGGDITGTSTGSAHIGYYGEAGRPSEATGYIVYGESGPIEGLDRVKNLHVNIGFGTQRQ